SAFADTTGKVKDDILLRDQDEIRVFSRTSFRPELYISVVGAVRKPGRVLYREGMTVRDAVLLAGGLTEDAYLKEAEIARIANRSDPNALATTIKAPLDSTYFFGRGTDGAYMGPPGAAAAASGAPEVPLAPYDNVMISRQPGWDQQRLVYLTGQVKFPGRYALQSRTERLSVLIQRAGGLTPVAYAGGIQFYRAYSTTLGATD